MKPTLVAATLSFLAAACGAVAHENSSQIVVTGDQRCITSNGTPNPAHRPRADETALDAHQRLREGFCQRGFSA